MDSIPLELWGKNEILPYVAFAHYFNIAIEKQPLHHVSYESHSQMHSPF